MTSQAPSFDYQKPSTLATRTLVSGSKPTQISSTSSHDHEQGALEMKQQNPESNHYQKAILSAKNPPPAISEYTLSKPALDRQQSWKQSDTKRGVIEKLIGEQQATHGYTSTSPTS